MSISDRTKQYYAWTEVWHSEDPVSSKALELAFYKTNIKVKMEKQKDEWVIKVPWVHKAIAETAIAAYKEGNFEYPSEIQVNDRWESYNRFKPAKFRGRASKMILVIGLALFMLLLIRVFYGMHLFG